MIIEELFTHLLFAALHIGKANLFPPPLPADQERELLIRLKKGDEKAKEKLVEHNLRLVAHIIKKYYTVNADNDELISIGTVGLIKAINTFEGDKGTRLATYASRCIENEILMHFRNQRKSALDVSFEDPIETDSEGNPLTLIDVIAEEDTVLEDIWRKNNLKKLVRFVNEIEDPREKEIIILRYGLRGEAPLTQNDIGKLYGISRSYVSRIETKALKKLTFEMPWWKRVYSNDGKLTSVVPLPGVSVAKKAFAQCGKGGGSGLTVTFVSGVGEKEAPQFASLLRSRGMSKSATLKVY